MKTLACSLLALTIACAASAATTRNNDSCDISVLPAATLLLPYFEVDLDQPGGETTLFTVTNVTNTDAIARVTLWTDRGYPVLTFNVFLTGYDTQSLNLYDILARGVIAASPSPRGHFSDPNPTLRACDGLGGAPASPPAVVAASRAATWVGGGEGQDAGGSVLPSTGAAGRRPDSRRDAGAPAELEHVQAAFTTGSIPGVCEDIGGVHENATGYATVDVVGNCSANTPRDPAYWITDIRFDNILLGDYQQLGDAGAQGAPLVHIRAVPEGRTPRTFYSRYTTRDRRQPLPSQFAVRWAEGTSLRIWREGRTGVNATCADYAADASLAVTDIVTFDEQENAAGLGDDRVDLAAATNIAADDPLFPQLANGASSGWIYLNLDRSARDEFASQAWVVASTDAHGESTAVDAIALGNGCTPPAERNAQIAPRNEDDSCDIALLPAATLLLPYFEVDLDDREGEQTAFTLTNASPNDQIARVTLWTDYAFPVITFNVYLTGYDVQTIDLFDVIERGLIAPDAGTGTQVTERGPGSRRNLGLDLDHCEQLVGQLPEEYIIRMQSAFRNGTVPSLGVLAGCNNVGYEHDNAVGYATIDVVRNCSANGPLSEEYWSEDIGWDNVLIGDSTQTYADSGHSLAQSSPLVHIRALPGVRFPRTFYARYQSAKAPRRDGRQPLPSVFAARWIQGGEYETFFKIWREGPTGRDTTCPSWDNNVETLVETVRFDEAENPWGDVPYHSPYPIPEFLALPATSRIHTADSSILPQHDNGAVAGWFYLNLDDHDEDRPWATQNWVATSMRAAGRLSVDADAAALGNGCSPQAPSTEITIGTEVLRPRP